MFDWVLNTPLYRTETNNDYEALKFKIYFIAEAIFFLSFKEADLFLSVY